MYLLNNNVAVPYLNHTSQPFGIFALQVAVLSLFTSSVPKTSPLQPYLTLNKMGG